MRFYSESQVGEPTPPKVQELEDAPDVVDVDVERGTIEMLYFVTFRNLSIPSTFAYVHGLEFEGAYVTWTSLRWYERGPLRRRRLVGVFSPGEDSGLDGGEDGGE